MTIDRIDANVAVGHYPFRQFPFDSQDPAVIKERLQAAGIGRACVSSLHGIFYGDPQQGNDEFRPARNVTKGCYGMTCGTTYGNFNQDPSLWDPNANGAPFPRAVSLTSPVE